MGEIVTDTTSSTRILVRWVVMLLLIGAGAMVLVGGWPRATATVSDGELHIEVSGYRIDPGELVLPAGEEITLVVTNVGGFTHNLAVGRGPVRVDGHTVGFEEDLLAVAARSAEPAQALITPVDRAVPTTISVRPGATVRVEVEVPATLVGTWELGCFQGSGCRARIDQPAVLRVE